MEKKTFKLTIAAIDSVLFSGEAVSLTAPGKDGDLTVLARHVPLVTPLKRGDIRIRTEDGEKKNFGLNRGILTVNREEVIVLL